MPFPPEQLSPIDPRPLPDRESRLRTQVGMKDMQGAGDEAWNGTALPFCPGGDFTAASHTPWRPADSVGCALSSPAFDPPNGDPQHSQATRNAKTIAQECLGARAAPRAAPHRSSPGRRTSGLNRLRVS